MIYYNPTVNKNVILSSMPLGGSNRQDTAVKFIRWSRLKIMKMSLVLHLIIQNMNRQ